ncbi:hypothetical protein MBLNU457_4250t1 [Dothideomycetes sp. NU457]
MSASQPVIPPTPRVISPSPTPSEALNRKDDYFSSPATSARLNSPDSIAEDVENTSDPELSRARPRSRSPNLTRTYSKTDGKPVRRKPEKQPSQKADKETNGFLSPESMGARYWRELSRSPSPLGLIPIHKEWRTFVHKHEIPRKALHVSIGFFVLWLYVSGTQTSSVWPVLLAALIPIFLVDFVRLHLAESYPAINRVYIRYLGAFMRESEARDRYNGVISYLFGCWAVMYFCPKDTAVMSIVLLSWCDTAASTFGRLYGRYTPRVRKGKSLAGSIAAFVFGVGSAALFWGLIAPTVPDSWNQDENRFAFDGHLTLPPQVRSQLGLSKEQATVNGALALLIVSIWSGLVASVSEAIDILGFDDNMTIPILCGIGYAAFFKCFE